MTGADAAGMAAADDDGGVPRLQRLSVAAERLDVSREFLRAQLPPEALYRMGRRWFVDVDALGQWVSSQRADPGRTALRQEFARRVVRSPSALRREVRRDAEIAAVRQAARAAPGEGLPTRRAVKGTRC